MRTCILLGICVVLLVGQKAGAGTVPPLVFDEKGNGAFGPGFLANDPGPGGLHAVLTYHLPFAGVPGDVLLTDANAGGAFLDVIRFNGNGTLIFYSDNVDGADSLADTPSPPSALYPNQTRIPEVGPEGNNGAFYTPGPNDPGFDPSLPTYHFISDGDATTPVPVPLPLASLSALAACLVLLPAARKLRALAR
jgi:hypothetical protein